MKREDILYNVMVELAAEGNEKAKLALRLTEWPTSITSDKVYAELNHAMDMVNKSVANIDRGYTNSAKAELDKVRMHILQATTVLSQL